MENKDIYAEIGKTLAPVEYDGEEMLELFGITKKDLVPYLVGAVRVRVYPFPAPEEVCRRMLKDLREKYTKQSRRNRCMVRGVSGRLIVCPEKNSCSECPFAVDGRLPRTVSLEALSDAGREPEDRYRDLTGDVTVGEFLDYLRRADPACHRVLCMKLEGDTAADIARRLQLPYHRVRYLCDKIRDLAAGYFEEGA